MRNFSKWNIRITKWPKINTYTILIGHEFMNFISYEKCLERWLKSKQKEQDWKAFSPIGCAIDDEMTVEWLPDDIVTTARRLTHDCLTTARGLTWQLSDDWLMTAWRLTRQLCTRRLTHDCMATACALSFSLDWHRNNLEATRPWKTLSHLKKT